MTDDSFAGETDLDVLHHQIRLQEKELAAAHLALEVAAEKLAETKEALTLEYRARRLAEDRLAEVLDEKDELRAQLRRSQ